MHRRTRRPEEQERDAPGEQPVRATPAAEALLAVQRSAGNHAVSALLARAPDKAKPKEKDKPKEAAPAGTRATLPDIGTIPLLSVQFGGSRPTGRGRGEEDERQTSGEIVVSSLVGAHSQQLLKASLDGKPMTVEVVIAGSGSTLRLTLKGAMISSYSTGSGGGEEIETWTLNFQSLEQSVQGEATE
jgi:Type VI secretion system effector, Hcp